MDLSADTCVTPRREVPHRGGICHSTGTAESQPTENMRFQLSHGLPEILKIEYPTMIDIDHGDVNRITPLLQKSNNIFNPFDLDDMPPINFADVDATKVFLFSNSICSNPYISDEQATRRSIHEHESEGLSVLVTPPRATFAYTNTRQTTLCVRNKLRNNVTATSQSYRPIIVNPGGRTKTFYLKQYVHLNRLRPPEHITNSDAL